MDGAGQSRRDAELGPMRDDSDGHTYGMSYEVVCTLGRPHNADRPRYTSKVKGQDRCSLEGSQVQGTLWVPLCSPVCKAGAAAFFKQQKVKPSKRWSQIEFVP